MHCIFNIYFSLSWCNLIKYVIIIIIIIITISSSSSSSIMKYSHDIIAGVIRVYIAYEIQEM